MSDRIIGDDATDPQQIVAILTEHGWKQVGIRSGHYVRLSPSELSGSSEPTVVVPLDRSASDFTELLNAAKATIRDTSVDLWSRAIQPRLALAPTDTFRFKKETSAPPGLISWKDGADLIDSARLTLLAGAKAHIEPSRHFSNRFGQFAGRYLDEVLMGQSGIGSYVVTAHAPTAARVPIRRTAEGTLELDGVDIAVSGDVTTSVVRALSAAVEALEHFKTSGSMSGFDDRVNKGVSYELAIALRDIASGASESDITIELFPTAGRLPGSPNAETHHFEFTGGDVSVLDRAAVQLATPAEVEHVTVIGRVHLLTRKDVGAPGVVGVDDGKRRYRVRLGSDEEYHEAVIAHDEDRPITVAGDLSREGTISWLYDARLRQSPPEVRDPSAALQGELTEHDQEE